MTNTEFVFKYHVDKNTDFYSELDERSAKLMVDYFLEDEEYKELLEKISKLSPASFDLITYFLDSKNYH